MTTWIDAHNHLQDDRLGDPAPIISAMMESGVSNCVVNATREEDWDRVEDLAKTYPEFISPAFGIHPWYAHTAKHGWEHRLADRLEKHPQAAIGECGLDQWVDQPDLEIQLPVFIEQIRMAGEWKRPIVIHCLKAWGPLFDAFAIAPPPSRFLMHSYGGSIETARRLIPLGAYFSFSGYFLQPRKSSVLDVFQKLPKDRILLETDSPDMMPPHDVITHEMESEVNHPANLPAIGSALAAALAIRPEDLALLTAENTRKFLGH